MNDKHIEDILRESWSPESPDGMRDRVLRKTRESMLQEERAPRLRLAWRFVLVTAGVLIVFLTQLADRSTQMRLARMTEDRPLMGSTVVAQRPPTLGNWRTYEGLLVTDGGMGRHASTKGDDMP